MSINPSNTGGLRKHIMKNSNVKTGNAVVEKTNKEKLNEQIAIQGEAIKEIAVKTVKVIVYPAHLVCQTAADLLNIGQAQAINKIDGTPVLQSMMEQTTWTQHQQAKVVGKAIELRQRVLKQREFNRQQDIDKLKQQLDKLEGVEHVVSKSSTPVVVPVSSELTPCPVSSIIPTSVVSVPTPPFEKKQGPLAKAIDKVEQRIVQNTEVPLMSPNAVFAQ